MGGATVNKGREASCHIAFGVETSRWFRWFVIVSFPVYFFTYFPASLQYKLCIIPRIS